MHTQDVAEANIEKIGQLFPNCLTERINENGKPEMAIDFDKLKQELSKEVVEGNQERYQFTWPGKREAMRIANTPSNMTLRPDRESSVDFDNTENLYIEGDNLEVLKLLRENYLGKVKMIYIDPPYNTGNDFVYEDDFSQTSGEFMDKSGMFDASGNMLLDKYSVNSESNGRFHTDWINMIFPRLKVAKDLLLPDGVIFISIDDNEVDNLRKICDEVFGSANFLAHIIHKNNSMKNQSKYIGVTTEYVLVYCKDYLSLKATQPEWRVKKKGTSDVKQMFNSLKAKGLTINEIRDEILNMYSRPKYSHLGRWNKVDEGGVFTDKDLSRANGYKNFTIINPSTGKECPIPSRGWGKPESELKELQKQGLIWYGDGTNPPREKSYLSDDKDSVFDNYLYIDTSIDKRMLDEMLGDSVFEFPKPLEMISTFIQLCTDRDSIILDFFSGSATTAHATMLQNLDDNGSRRYILVQIPELTDKDSSAYKHGYKTICDIGKTRIKKSGDSIIQKAPSNNLFSTNSLEKKLDVGFRVLKLDTSNMQDVYYKPEEFSETSLFEDNVKPDRTPEDLLFQVMLECNLPLSAKIERKTIAGKEVFNVNDGYLLACFEEDVNESVITEVAKLKPYYFIMRDKSLGSDNVADNFEQIFNAYSKDTIRKIL